MKTLRFLAGAALVLSVAACNTEEGTRSQYQRDATETTAPEVTPAAGTAVPAGTPEGHGEAH